MNNLESSYRYQLKYGCNGLNCSNYFCHQFNFIPSEMIEQSDREKEINRIASILTNSHNENGGKYLCKYLSPAATKPYIIQNIHEFNAHLVFKEVPEKSDFDVFKTIFNDAYTFEFILLANNNFYLSSYDLSLNDQKCDDFRMKICSSPEFFDEFVPLFAKFIKEQFYHSKVKRTLHFLRGLIISTIFSQFICNTLHMSAFSVLISLILKTDLVLFCRQMSKMPRVLQNFVSVCHNAITILLIQDDDNASNISRINQINQSYNSSNNASPMDNNDAAFIYENALRNHNIGRGNIRSDLLHNICQVLQNLSNMASKNDIFIHEQLTSYLNVNEELKNYEEKRLFSFLYTPAVLTFEFRKQCYFATHPFDYSKTKIISIRRNRIATDAHKLLNLTKSDLEGVIQFKFEGEDAMDFGGVRREFFSLMGKTVTDLRSGIFRKISNEFLWFYPDFDEKKEISNQYQSLYNNNSVDSSFSSSSTEIHSIDGSISYDSMIFSQSLSYEPEYEPDDKIALAEIDDSWFRLLGMLAGLCVRYQNGEMLNIKLPILLYKSLIQKEITKVDLMEIYPDIIMNLEKLSHYKKEEFDQLDLRFSAQTVNHSIFDPMFPDYSSSSGSSASSTTSFDSQPYRRQYAVSDNLIQNGCEIRVTEENVHEYINSYFTFLLKRLFNKKYSLFYQGFVRVVGDNLCAWFTPEEISTIVSGEEVFEWDDLYRNTIYTGGYDGNSLTISFFWDIFFNVFTQSERKKLLFFITGLRRSPIGGLKTIQLRIDKTEDVSYLPIAHTCIMSLGLPDYKDKTVLENSLRVCLSNSEGFGFA